MLWLDEAVDLGRKATTTFPKQLRVDQMGAAPALHRAQQLTAGGQEVPIPSRRFFRFDTPLKLTPDINLSSALIILVFIITDTVFHFLWHYRLLRFLKLDGHPVSYICPHSPRKSKDDAFIRIVQMFFFLTFL